MIYKFDKIDNKRHTLTILIMLAAIASISEFLSISLILPLINKSSEIEDLVKQTLLLFTISPKLPSANILLCITIGFIFSFKYLITFIITYAQSNIIKNILLNLSNKIYHSYLQIEVNHFSSGVKGKFYKDVVMEVNRYVHGFIVPYVNIISELMVFLALAILIAIKTPQIILSILPLLVLSGVTYTFFINKKIATHGKNRIVKDTLRIQLLKDISEMFIETKLYKFKNYITEKYNNATESSFESEKIFYFYQVIPRILIDIILVLTIMISIVQIGFNPSYTDSEAVSYLVMLALIGLRLGPSLNRVMSYIQILKSNKSLHLDFQKKLESISQIYLSNATINNSDTNIVIKEISINDLSIRLSDKTISYPNLSFNSGKCYVISGISGRGKTLLLGALCGIIDHSGTISLNGKVIESYIRSKLFAYSPQKPYIFHGTVNENIYFDTTTKCSDKNILKFLPSIDLNKDVDYENLSGGQTQRIGIVRAIESNRQVILLDEPTSNLDLNNKLKFTEIINDRLKNSITIIVTHDEYLLNNELFEKISL